MNEQPTFQPQGQSPRKNRKSLKITAIITASILVLAVLGYSIYAWQQNANLQNELVQQEKESDNLAKENADLKKEMEKLQDTDADQQSKGVVRLTDWGVEFRLVDSLLNTEVKYSATTANDETAYVLTTSRIQNLGGQCVKEPFGQTVILTRFSEKPIATPDGNLINEMPINGYYYVSSSPIASCSGMNEDGSMRAPSQVETSDRAVLIESVKSLKAIQ